MVIYLDIVFLINFIIDLLLLLTVNIALKRYAKLHRLVLAALFGSLSLLTLFLNINSITLFIFKLLLSILMVFTAFSYKNIKYILYNLLYFYMTSIILGGFLYYLKIEFSYSNKGLVFYYEGLTINYLFLCILAPLILFLFIKSLKVLKEIKNYYYQVRIVFNNDYILNVVGFLDTGNKLKDPITNKGIIILNKKIIKGKYNIRSPMYVPINTINSHSLLECVKPKELYINNKLLKNYLIGFTNTSFKLNGIDCLLNYQIWEDIND